MHNPANELLDLEQICQSTLLSTEVVIEIVQYGIVEPVGDVPEKWRFNVEMITRLHKAKRLKRDLDINWPGIALALELLEQMDKLKAENKMLAQRLNRFLSTSHGLN